VVNGTAGVIVSMEGKPVNVMGFSILDGMIVEINTIADPERVEKIATAASTDE
jgi:RNA polymerase sigma-70 factor (ECF subfamily)